MEKKEIANLLEIELELSTTGKSQDLNYIILLWKILTLRKKILQE